MKNSDSPIAEDGINKLFWSDYFQRYVASEW